ncbi:MAG: ABC transporter permease [Paraglaciecola sp.]|uniref:ABC transporter permease n=1 Tax=Paraglaciecola sp. TaxID=1920173 RepID=UPI003298F3AB
MPNLSEFTHAAPSRNAFKIMCDTVHALLMREVKARFGSSKLGYFWAIAEPIAQAAVLGLLFTLIGRSSLANVPVALFLFTGILPFKLFSKLLPQLSLGIASNKALFAYRQVAPVDPVITRLVIEIATYAIVYLVIMAVLAWLGFDVLPDQLLPFFVANGLLVIISFGLGLALCAAVQQWDDTPKLLSMVLTPMFYVSGVFFAATMIPAQYWYLLTWNPIFHIIELSRDAYFDSYTTPVGDWQYVMLFALGSLFLGLGLYRINRVRFSA